MYLCICMQIYFYIWHTMADSDGHRLLAGSNGSILQTLGLPCEMVVFLAGGQLLFFFCVHLQRILQVLSNLTEALWVHLQEKLQLCAATASPAGLMATGQCRFCVKTINAFS